MVRATDQPTQRTSEAAGQGCRADLSPPAYSELKSLAAHLLRRRANGSHLTATWLVHEAYLRMAQSPGGTPADRVQLLALAAKAMRSVIVDHVRRVQAEKRGGGRVQFSLDHVVVFSDDNPDILILDEALDRLAEFDERKSRIVELRFFGGLGVEETAEIAGLSAATVKREWAMAKAWLSREIGGG